MRKHPDKGEKPPKIQARTIQNIKPAKQKSEELQTGKRTRITEEQRNVTRRPLNAYQTAEN